MSYGPKDLRDIGMALFGDRHWQAGLTRALGLSDSRRIRHWLAGSRPVPEGVWSDLVTLLKARKKRIEDILGRLI